ncbi:MAG: DUF2934 domain-containing protein [Nitrosomonas sp.]|nr:MAG: DUF2934 domain-containing protein [Nitrosomonas sp.]
MDNSKVNVKTTKRSRSKLTKSEENVLASQITAPESAIERDELIATAAYFRAEKRGFTGNEADAVEDWLEAEREVNNKLKNFNMTASARQSSVEEELCEVE